MQPGMQRVCNGVCATRHSPQAQRDTCRACALPRAACPPSAPFAQAAHGGSAACCQRGLRDPLRPPGECSRAQDRLGQPVAIPLLPPDPSPSRVSPISCRAPLRAHRPRMLGAGGASFVIVLPKMRPSCRGLPGRRRCMLCAPRGCGRDVSPALFSRRFYSHSHSHQISHGPEAPRLQGLH